MSHDETSLMEEIAHIKLDNRCNLGLAEIFARDVSGSVIIENNRGTIDGCKMVSKDGCMIAVYRVRDHLI